MITSTHKQPGRARGSRRRRGIGFAATILWVVLLATAEPAEAYVGPGAGFALLSSFLVLFATTVAAVVSLLFWPFRMLWRRLRGGKPPRPSIRRLVIVGLDGQDPALTDRFMEQGLLPNFRKLAEAGCYRRLRTTFPSVSPVAWSSFSTGTQPGRHNIFDFLDRDRRTYLPRAVVCAPGQRQAVLQARPLPHPARSGPSCACCASRSRSGSCSASTASGARSCACRSRFHRIGSTARS